MGTSKMLLKQSSEFEKYLKIIEDNDKIGFIESDAHDNNWPGAFKPTRDLQEQVMTQRDATKKLL
jgi:hypothetical protein